MKKNVLKKHYIDYHSVNEDDIYFRELFKPDTHEKKCKICRVNFDNARMKKKTYVFVVLSSRLVVRELVIYL